MSLLLARTTTARRRVYIELRRAVAEKISAFNGIVIDPEGDPLQLLITPGATGALIAIAQTYLRCFRPGL